MRGEGLFISIEGGEGSGKSSLLRRLKAWFESAGRPCLCTREPGGTPFAEEVRGLWLHRNVGAVSTLAELLLLLAARTDHVDKVIAPALRGGTHVVCDRYVDSTVAYQAYARGMDAGKVWELSTSLVPLLPDVTFVLDVPVEQAFARIKERQKDRMEREDQPFHERVREGFLAQALAFPERIVVLNASEREEDVAARAAAFLEARCT